MVYGVDLDTIWRGFQSQVLLQLESLPSQKLKPQLESGGCEPQVVSVQFHGSRSSFQFAQQIS